VRYKLAIARKKKCICKKLVIVSLYLNCEKKIRIVRLAILSYKVFRVRILSYSINWDLQVIQSEL